MSGTTGEYHVEEDSVKEESQQEQLSQQGLVSKRVSWNKLRRYDSFDIESRRIPGRHGHASKVHH